jgi:bacteriocin-like protein
MRKLNNNELNEIIGGASLSGTLINAFVRGINALLDLGRSLGNAIRRINSKSICPL